MTGAPLLSTSASVLVAPFSILKGTFTIREARPNELDVISWAAGEAFIDDVMTHYFAGSKKPMTITNDKDVANLRDFCYLLFKTCMAAGGRIIIAVQNTTRTRMKIVSAIAWYPPRKRPKKYNVLKGGILAVIRNWGLTSLLRLSGFEDSTHRICKQAFRTKAMEFPASTGIIRNEQRKYLEAEDAWYLNIVFTSRKYEGLGLLSILMYEGYTHIRLTTPGIPIILQSSSEKSRNWFLHLGFELMERQTILGDKKVTALGITPADKEQARKQQDELTGILYWNMVNWNPSKSIGRTEQKGEL